MSAPITLTVGRYYLVDTVDGSGRPCSAVYCYGGPDRWVFAGYHARPVMVISELPTKPDPSRCDHREVTSDIPPVCCHCWAEGKGRTVYDYG